MAYRIKEFKNKKVEDTYERCMAELAGFYGFKITRNRPRIIVVESRAIIDSLKGSKTEDWLVGWLDGRNIFLLDQPKMETESCHGKYDNEQYKALIKHELSHAFTRGLSWPGYVPVWLNEGIAIYVSGQNKFKKPINKFHNFLDSYDKAERDVYKEAGFAIELLVNKFGKKKLLTLVKKLRGIKNKSGYIRAFKGTYGFSPSYAKFNGLK